MVPPAPDHLFAIHKRYLHKSSEVIARGWIIAIICNDHSLQLLIRGKKMRRIQRFPGQAMLAAIIVFESALPVWAHEPGAHVHGRAALEIAIDGAAVQVNLKSPLDNLLGFEHAPRNEKERQAVKAMASKFNQADSLFIFTPAARCRLESTDLTSPVLSADLLAPASDSGKSADKSSGKNNGVSEISPSGSSVAADAHAELEATWQFQCAQPQALQGVDVRLFQMFPGLRRLDAAIAGPKRQSSTKLSPESPRLKW